MRGGISLEILQEVQSVAEDEKVVSLWRSYKQNGSTQMRNELVLHYMNLVKKIAFKTYKNAWYLECADELVNEGVIAMISVIDRFDVDMGIKFETFASRRIQGAMVDYIHKQSGFVRKIHEMTKKINLAKDEFVQTYGRLPDNNELAQKMGISRDELETMIYESQPVKTFSIHQTESGTADEEKIIEISTGNDADPIEILTKTEYNEELVRGIESLNEQQQLVLSLFYKEEFSVSEIAEILNLSTEKVSQIRFQSIKKLKKLVSDKINK